MEKEYRLSELAKISGISPSKIRSLIKRGYIKATKKKVVVPIEKVVVYGERFSKKRKEHLNEVVYSYVINHEDWLAIPTFIRENWRKESQERGKKN